LTTTEAPASRPARERESIRNQQVIGSNPIVGSSLKPDPIGKLLSTVPLT